jgi:UDP-N-acetylglucosamine acyltransferase
MTNIHPDARIGANVTVSPFTTIEADVEIGDNTWIGPNVTIFDGARIGSDCKIFPGAVISAIPQDLKFRGEKTHTTIGNNTTIRECVTINRGTEALGKTVVGANCLLMAYVHVAHDCIVGNNVILANSVNLAGHVIIDDWAILEGYVGVSQFIRIGEHSFIAGQTGVRKNVPPFVKAAREPLAYAGINSVGLKRRGYSEHDINDIQEFYRVLFLRGHSVSNAINIIEENNNSAIIKEIIEFIKQSDKGIIKGLSNSNE